MTGIIINHLVTSDNSKLLANPFVLNLKGTHLSNCLDNFALFTERPGGGQMMRTCKTWC